MRSRGVRVFEMGVLARTGDATGGRAFSKRPEDRAFSLYVSVAGHKRGQGLFVGCQNVHRQDNPDDERWVCTYLMDGEGTYKAISESVLPE